MSKQHETNTVAQTILEQLGGNRFLAMTGAKDLLDLGDGLKMRVGRNARSVTHVTIILHPSDTYQVRTQKVSARGLTVVELGRADCVYADLLRDVFERLTGLRTSL